MENVIKQVIESEYRAQEIIREVKEEQRVASLNIEKEVSKIKEDIFMSARQKLEDIKIANDKYAEAQVEKILSEARAKALSLYKELEMNKASWVRCLLNSILGW